MRIKLSFNYPELEVALKSYLDHPVIIAVSFWNLIANPRSKKTWCSIMKIIGESKLYQVWVISYDSHNHCTPPPAP
ncbi:hypothetical protein, partial [uncultured Nostoc sp.]